MKVTVTAKLKILPFKEQQALLQQTVQAYQNGCNFVSGIVFQTNTRAQAKLHHLAYASLRADFGLRSQMAQSVMKTVLARYQSMRSNGHPHAKAVFNKGEYDLVWNRDYSLV
ncbi:transposase [Brevibacillus brevis]|uniref:transposase n=1 Tax=Brevibacillus brevis TaxID=1393 RepID=UPI0037C63E59